MIDRLAPAALLFNRQCFEILCRTDSPDELLALAPKNPMVGSLPACCARAASGHAAAPPSKAMNSRRFMCPVPRYGAACPAGLPRTSGYHGADGRSLGQT